MSTYMVLPRRQQSGYKVEVVTDDGIRQTALGFETEADAEVWVDADRKLDQTFREAS